MPTTLTAPTTCPIWCDRSPEDHSGPELANSPIHRHVLQHGCELNLGGGGGLAVYVPGTLLDGGSGECQPEQLGALISDLLAAEQVLTPTPGASSLRLRTPTYAQALAVDLLATFARHGVDADTVARVTSVSSAAADALAGR